MTGTQAALSGRTALPWLSAAVASLILAVLAWASDGAFASAADPVRWAMSVEPLADGIQTVERGGRTVFVVPEAQTKPSWRFTYRLENVSSEILRGVILADRFAANLDIISVSAAYNPGTRPGTVDVWSQSAGEPRFRWHGFDLAPGEWAELVIVVGMGAGSSGGRHAAACDLFALNAEPVLSFAAGGSSRASRRPGNVVYAEISCPPFLEIQMNTKVTWLIRMPGDYVGRIIDGLVHASHPVIVTFSQFDDLKHANNDQTLPVYYALDEEPSSGWLTPSELNKTTLLLPTDRSAVSWHVWQRVVLDGQPAGTYSNTGVITFTLQNVQDAHH